MNTHDTASTPSLTSQTPELTLGPSTPLTGSPDVPKELADFLHKEIKIEPGSGSSYWQEVIKALQGHGDNWKNPENGTTKFDVIADMLRKMHPDLVNQLQQGGSIQLDSINLSSDEMDLLSKAMNSSDAQDYINNVMPLFNKYLNRG